jgi:hypothetical protein
MAWQALVKGALAFLDVLRCGFLQHRGEGSRRNQCGSREQRTFHLVLSYR